MKRVVLPLSFLCILFTLSSAFHPESLHLSQVINHHHHDHHQIKPTTSDGSDSPNILLTMDSSTVPEHTESSPVEFKEAVSEPEIVDEEINPVQMRNRLSFPVYRLNPIRCRKLNRFMRQARRVNDLGFDPILTYVIRNRDLAREFLEVERAIRLFDQNYLMEPLHRRRHHHHHHDHDDHDEEDEEDQLVEMKEEDHDEEDREYGLKKKGKNEKDEDKDDKEKHKKKRKEKDGLKKKHKERDHEHDAEEDEDENNVEKYVFKKIRKFMNIF